MTQKKLQSFPYPHLVPEPPASIGTHDIPNPEVIRYIVAHGILAPSGGNFQAWKFNYRQGCLRCMVDTARTGYFTNYRWNESFISLGAAVMNIQLSSRVIGCDTELRVFPDPGNPHVVCDISFHAGTSVPDEVRTLAAMIPYRITSRSRGERMPLADENQKLLEDIADTYGAQLLFITDSRKLSDIGPVIGKLNHIGYLNQESHKGIMMMLRWTDDEAAATRDGIHVKTFEMTPLELTGLRFLNSYQVLKYINNLGTGRSLENIPVAWAKSSSALCLLVMNQEASAKTFFQAGRILEHLWLCATRCNLSFHVLGLNSFFDRLEHGGGEGFSPGECADLKELRSRYVQLFGIPPGVCETVLFRIIPPNPLVDRTFRRYIDDVLNIE